VAVDERAGEADRLGWKIASRTRTSTVSPIATTGRAPSPTLVKINGCFSDDAGRSTLFTESLLSSIRESGGDSTPVVAPC
jgi:hypothetical protein